LAQHFRAPARGAFFCSTIVDIPSIAVGTRRALSETSKFAQIFLGTEHAENTEYHGLFFNHRAVASGHPQGVRPTEKWVFFLWNEAKRNFHEY
jgi:hypothetical protein